MPIPFSSKLRSLDVSFGTASSLFSSGCRFHALRELRVWPHGTSYLYSLISTQFPLIFTQFPLLEILDIRFTISSHTPGYETTPVLHSLQNVHTFVLAGNVEFAVLWLLDWFDAPALKSLAISIMNPSPREFKDGDRLSNFLVRCGAQLHRLMLNGNFLSFQDLVGLTCHTPILESLCVHESMLDGDLMTLCPTHSLSHIDILLDSSVVWHNKGRSRTTTFVETSHTTANYQSPSFHSRRVHYRGVQMSDGKALNPRAAMLRIVLRTTIHSQLRGKASRLKGHGHISAISHHGHVRLNVPLAVLRQQGVKKSVLQSLPVPADRYRTPLPFLEDSWWPKAAGLTTADFLEK
ncbi:hypothetical protein BD410DRAFT_840332 [Rickenella mellea]|uniref:F-box domain-containing protein n=1 Tax=Rickenella mellea TaxID=50990 RepID=A0A4Y7Q1W9_9AGAM|nr:hypothetical protein BD410DRAFT_840332 [Rickenella mellea]